MALFKYTARNKTGEIKKGEMEAVEEREVMENLKKSGLWVTQITQGKLKKVDQKGGESFLDKIFTVPLKNKMIFCRHLAVMINSGLALPKSLAILQSQEKNKTLRVIIGKMAMDVQKGVGFADAMEKYPKTFNAVFVSMVKMGEMSGKLEEVLKILAEQLEKDHKLVSKIRGAMIYPAIIFVVMILMGILMMTYVVPKVTGIFEDFGADLPTATKVLLKVSNFMSENTVLVIGGAIMALIIIYSFSKTKAGIRFFHKLFLKLPVVGIIVIKVNSARFSRILSSLLDSGVSLIKALQITSDTLGNYYFKTAAFKASREVQKGVSLSEILKKHEKTFPYLVIQMIEVGEETGRTPEVLKKLAGFYEEEVDQITKNLSSIIEPVLMVIIGVAVGFFAIAVIQPIYSIMDRI